MSGRMRSRSFPAKNEERHTNSLGRSVFGGRKEPPKYETELLTNATETFVV
jgi:hypothetical protein